MTGLGVSRRITINYPATFAVEARDRFGNTVGTPRPQTSLVAVARLWLSVNVGRVVGVVALAGYGGEEVKVFLRPIGTDAAGDQKMLAVGWVGHEKA